MIQDQPRPAAETPTPSRRTAFIGRRTTAVLAAAVLLSGTGAGAFAFWQASSRTSDAVAAADTLPQGARPTVAASGQDVAVSWDAGTTAGGRAVTGYALTRYDAASGGTGIPATGACAGTVSALSCTEAGLPGGTWYYTVTPVMGRCAGVEGPRSSAAVTDTAAPTVTVASVSPGPNAAGYNNTSPVVVTLAAQDEAGGSGVASVAYVLDGGQQVSVPGTTADVTVSGDGSHTLVYSATDRAGNTSASQSLTVRIDTARPGTPTLAVPAVVNAANAAAVPVTGAAEAGSTVTVTARDGAGTTATRSAVADGSGSWALTLDVSGLADGTLTFSAIAADAAGNASPATSATAGKDATPPGTPTLSAPALVTGATVSSVSVNGTAEPGAAVTLRITDAGAAHILTRNLTADAGGLWSASGLDLGGLDEGQLTYTATATDVAGNASPTASRTGTKDAVSATPTFTSITGTTLANGSIGITSEQAKAVRIDGRSDAGATVTVTAADSSAPTRTVSSTVTADAGGVWSVTYNLSTFATGPVTFTARATDPAGNVSGLATAPGRIGARVSNVTLQNVSGTAGKADTGDRVVIEFSSRMNASTFCASWTNSAVTNTLSGANVVTVTIVDGGVSGGSNVPDRLTLSASCGATTFVFGEVSLDANYVDGGNLIFKGNGNSTAASQVSLTPSGVLTVTLGANATNGKNITQPTQPIPPGATPKYTPAQGLADDSGVPLSMTQVSGTASSF